MPAEKRVEGLARHGTWYEVQLQAGMYLAEHQHTVALLMCSSWTWFAPSHTWEQATAGSDAGDAVTYLEQQHPCYRCTHVLVVSSRSCGVPRYECCPQ